MIGFWVAAALLAAIAAAFMLGRAANGVRLAACADPQLEVYRRAIGDIDDLGDRDLLAPDERRQLRAEAARRLLGAAVRPTPPISVSRGPAVPIAAAAGVALLALGLYGLIGSPGLADQPFAERLAAWKANPETASPGALAATLATVADSRPDDPTPLRKLAALDIGLGDADGAAHALRRALILEPDNADLAAMLGEVKVIQSSGALTPDARVLFQRAYRQDPHQAAARYYLARAAIADGDMASGLAQWRALLADLPSTDPRRSALAAEIASTVRSGRLAPPTGLQTSSPTPDLSVAVRGMVDGLAARLASRPDDPGGWVRLVRAYAVLGDARSRDRALASARARYAGQAAELAALANAAMAPPMAGGRR